MDPAGLENARMFFSLLDELPLAEESVLDGTLDERMRDLYALPDPSVSERCGIQLMTIHHSKGLEFEVVLIPGLETLERAPDRQLLEWLEIGRASGTAASDLLLSPVGRKGDKSSARTSWIRAQRRAREEQERQRLFYVACTRAREELHLFGTASLNPQDEPAPPSGSLLAAAWPALRAKFEQAARTPAAAPQPLPSVGEDEPSLLSLAASAQPVAGSRIRRLPPEALPAPRPDPFLSPDAGVTQPPAGLRRPQGSLHARSYGVVLHALLERLAREAGAQSGPLRADESFEREARVAFQSAGQDAVGAARMAGDAVQTLRRSLGDPALQWILAPHPQAGNEAAWTGETVETRGRLESVRVDRLFLAGDGPGRGGDSCWWVVDYKTAEHAGAGIEDFLARERAAYEPQLGVYAALLRAQKNDGRPVFAGLYYPRLCRLLWWPA